MQNIEQARNLQNKGMLDGALKPVAAKVSEYLDKYQRFEQSNPVMAKTALISAFILSKGITGAVAGYTSTGNPLGATIGFGIGLAKGRRR